MAPLGGVLTAPNSTPLVRLWIILMAEFSEPGQALNADPQADICHRVHQMWNALCGPGQETRDG